MLGTLSGVLVMPAWLFCTGAVLATTPQHSTPVVTALGRTYDDSAVLFGLGLFLLACRCVWNALLRLAELWPALGLYSLLGALALGVADASVQLLAAIAVLIGTVGGCVARRLRGPLFSSFFAVMFILFAAAGPIAGPALAAPLPAPDDVMIRPLSAAGGYSQGHGLLDQMGYISGVTNAAEYLATLPNAGPSGWFGQGTWGCWEPRFDFGHDTWLTGMVVWEGNDYYGQAVAAVHLLAFDDQSHSTDLGWFGFDPRNGHPQWVAFPHPVAARTIVWAWYEDDGNGFSCEVDEVAFTGPGVPEPATAGLGALGVLMLYMLRRRAV